MELDDEVVEDDFLFGAVCNSTSVGGILTLNPEQVDMTDGLLEILLVRAPRSLLEIAECIQAVQNQRYNDCAMITSAPPAAWRSLPTRKCPGPWTASGRMATTMSPSQTVIWPTG